MENTYVTFCCKVQSLQWLNYKSNKILGACSLTKELVLMSILRVKCKDQD